MELHNVLQQLRAEKNHDVFNKDYADIMCWIDKCCIPQDNEDVKAICVLLIEDFLKRSKGLIVILSWHYFTRLWCVYEWACFLRMHHPTCVEVGCDAFLKDSATDTLPLLLQSIEQLS